MFKKKNPDKGPVAEDTAPIMSFDANGCPIQNAALKAREDGFVVGAKVELARDAHWGGGSSRVYAALTLLIETASLRCGMAVAVCVAFSQRDMAVVHSSGTVHSDSPHREFGEGTAFIGYLEDCHCPAKMELRQQHPE